MASYRNYPQLDAIAAVNPRLQDAFDDAFFRQLEEEAKADERARAWLAERFPEARVGTRTSDG